MALAFNEEQRSLKDTAKDFAQNKSPVEALRKLRDQNHPVGFSKELWSEMTELGWGGMTFPEAYGGFDFGFMGLAGCMEEFGRTLVASPLLSTVVLSGSTILFAGNEEQKQALLPSIASGNKILALALEESVRHNPTGISLQAKSAGDNWILDGTKITVIDGATAELLVVAARTSGTPGDQKGITLFLISPTTPGITVTRTSLVDSRNYAKVEFREVTVGPEAVLGTVDNGFESLDKALDRGRICLAAEMFGGIQEAFERTVEYLKERKQFGHLIGSFQALQHRCAYMYTEIQVCKSALMAALDAIELNSKNAPSLVSAAKAKISETFELVTNEATQMHGGIGVTDELEIGFFLKRARVAQLLLGDANFHYDRYASLEGF